MYKSMFPMKNGLNIMYFLYTGSHKGIPIHYGLWGGGGECLKRILTYLHSTKYNVINKSHSCMQKHVFYEK